MSFDTRQAEAEIAKAVMQMDAGLPAEPIAAYLAEQLNLCVVAGGAPSVIDRFHALQRDPEYIGGTIFTVDDVADGMRFDEHDGLSDHLVERGNDYIDQFCYADEEE